MIRITICCLFLLLTAPFLSGCTGTDSWSAADWMEQGNRFAEEDLFTEAVDAYTHSLDKDPSNYRVLTYRGVAYQHLGNTTAAMADFEGALSMAPRQSGAWQGKSATFIDLGEPDNALKAADKAIEYAVDGDKVENAYLLKGFALNRLEQYEDALQAFDAAIEIDPKRLDLWQHKAYTLTKLGRFMEVLKCYDVMTGIKPGDAELWNRKGEIYLALGQINEANEAFSMAKTLIKGS